MKHNTFFIGLFSLVLCLNGSLSFVSAQETTKVIAHRGFWKAEKSAQNSIKSLSMADDISVYGSEFDVHLTADNVPVVFHDNKFHGYPIQQSLYADLKGIPLGNGETLPTLDSYLAKGRLLKTKLIFELKAHETPERNREAARASVDMVNKYGLQARTEYITFNLDAAKELIRLSPNTPVYYLNGELAPKELKELGFAGLDYNYKKMIENPQWFKEAKELGLKINVWTVDDEKMMEDMIRQGADFITTDEPLLLQNVIQRVSNK